MNLGKRYLVWALGYGVLGMSLGIFMAASQDHSQHVTHAHILLIGLVVSFIYSTIHRFWLSAGDSKTGTIQFYLHHAGALVLFAGLFLLYGGLAASEMLEPILALASITVFAGLLLMLYLVIRAPTA